MISDPSCPDKTTFARGTGEPEAARLERAHNSLRYITAYPMCRALRFRPMENEKAGVRPLCPRMVNNHSPRSLHTTDLPQSLAFDNGSISSTWPFPCQFEGKLLPDRGWDSNGSRIVWAIRPRTSVPLLEVARGPHRLGRIRIRSSGALRAGQHCSKRGKPIGDDEPLTFRVGTLRRTQRAFGL
jgi:hypothetical protein